jgi:hypothetical protein
MAATTKSGAEDSAAITTTLRPATDLAANIAGFVAGDGTFTAADGKFAFAIALGASDSEVCELIFEFFGVGTVRRYSRRRPHYDDEVVFAVQSVRDLVTVIVPFMDEHLLPSHKRDQYQAWRSALLDYWEHGIRRRRRCSRPGCGEPTRAKGLCRHHYYEAYGR